jgi:hypothetical protein
MKKVFLLLLIFSTCFFTMSDARVVDEDFEEIVLYGDLPTNRQRSLANPIQAFKNENSLQLKFSSNLGTIVIYIYDETDSVIYQQSVSTNSGQQVYIDITLLSSGEYTIEFVNSQNKYLRGNFEI